MGEAKQKADAKKAEFEKNPDMFVDIRELLFAVRRRDEKGYEVVNNCRCIEDVFMVQGYALESMQNRRDQIRVMAASKKNSGIEIVKTMPPLPGSGGSVFPAEYAKGHGIQA